MISYRASRSETFGSRWSTAPASCTDFQTNPVNTPDSDSLGDAASASPKATWASPGGGLSRTRPPGGARGPLPVGFAPSSTLTVQAGGLFLVPPEPQDRSVTVHISYKSSHTGLRPYLSFLVCPTDLFVCFYVCIIHMGTAPPWHPSDLAHPHTGRVGKAVLQSDLGLGGTSCDRPRNMAS